MAAPINHPQILRTTLHLFAAMLSLSLALLAMSCTNAEIMNPKFNCTSPSGSVFTADIKSTDSTKADYIPTVAITEPAECMQLEQGKNQDGTPCTSGLCLGYCAKFGPEKEVTFTPQPAVMSIDGGATVHLQIPFNNIPMKKAKITVLEQGKTGAVSKPIASNQPCLF